MQIISESPRFEGCNVLQAEKHLSIGGMKLNLAEKNVVIHDAEVMLTNSPLRLRFLTCILEEISYASCITYFPTAPKEL